MNAAFEVALVKATSNVMGSPPSVLNLTLRRQFLFSTTNSLLADRSRNLASTLLESWIGRGREYRRSSRNYR